MKQEADLSHQHVSAARRRCILSSSQDPCQVRQILKDRMQADLKAYRDDIDELRRYMGEDFLEAQKKAEQAELAYKASRDKLNEHITSHGC
jgi:hypothetical protein